MWVTENFNDLKPHIISILEQAEQGRSFVSLDIDATVLRRSENHRRVFPVPEGMFVRNVAQQLNIPVVYITAREEGSYARDITFSDLAHVGIVDPLVVVLRPPHVRTWPEIAQFKKSAREYIEHRTNSQCVLNVGDQWTDIIPIDDETWVDMRHTFQNKYLLFANADADADVNDNVKWSLKLQE